MRRFWNARAREDALYFVDNRRAYRDRDEEGFWDVSRELDAMLDALGVHIEPTDVVLEIGCGVGRITRVLAERAERVLALDVSNEMLARARALNPQLEAVTWIRGDGTSLGGLGEDSVDACVSTVVFQHLPDPAIALGYVHELGRVLRPGAWAALQVSNAPAVHEPRTTWRTRLAALLGRAPRGQGHPAWLGTAVDLASLRAAAAEVGLDLGRVWLEGTQYCTVMLSRSRGDGQAGG